MSKKAGMEKCVTCYGDGVVGTDNGMETCQDCLGLGVLPSATVLTERRLRELEKAYVARDDTAAKDVEWLVDGVRRANHALLQILAASQEAEDGDAIATRIRHLANDVLGVYTPEPE